MGIVYITDYYEKYFSYDGLAIYDVNRSFTIQSLQNADALQAAILKSW